MVLRSNRGLAHNTHNVWCSVLDVLSHEIIIGLIDFEDPIKSSRHIQTAYQLGCHPSTVPSQIQDTSETTHTPTIMRNAMFLDRQQRAMFLDRQQRVLYSVPGKV